MSNYLKTNKPLTRESIIGLGESSVRKNYYPELQDKISTLEKMRSRNQALIMAIPDILLVSDTEFHLTPFSTTSRQEVSIALSIMRKQAISDQLKKEIQRVYQQLEPRNFNFELVVNTELKQFEARLRLTEQNEVLVIIRDITERVALENQLRTMAETDYDTGLMNRRKFETVSKSFEERSDQTLGLIVFDIDGLKGINETLGHHEGNQVIKIVAQEIEKNFHDAFCIGRIGGNEFGVAYLNREKKELEALCDTFKSVITTYNKGKTYDVSVSYGISHSMGEVISLSQLFQTADYNLYNNKLLKDSSSKSALVRSLMKALEAKDYITEGHAERMTENAKRLGIHLGLEQHRLDQLTLLTKFHDLGKVGIPDDILKKAGPLTPEEWKIMETHTTIGKRIASVSPELNSISELILMHHEKYDGTGYPLGIKGEDIPLECRILSLVDAFDAMTNDRPYRKALSFEQSIGELQRCSGTQFDPVLVELFVDYLSSFANLND